MRTTSMWNQHDRLLVERRGLVGWLGLPSLSPLAYRERKGDILRLLESARPKAWDDDDIAEDEDEEDDDDELLPDDDADDAEDDEDDDDVEEEDE